METFEPSIVGVRALNAMGQHTTMQQVLRAQRTKLKLRQHQIPGFTRQEISQYENGLRPVPSHRLPDLAESLGLDLDYLLLLISSAEEMSEPTVDATRGEISSRGAAVRRKVYGLLNEGRVAEAHEVALQWSRAAEATEIGAEIYEATNLVNELVRQLPPQQVVEAVLANVGNIELVESFGNAVWSYGMFDLAKGMNRYANRLYPEHSPGHAKHMRNYARILFKQGFLDEAYTTTEQAIDLSRPHLSADRILALEIERDYVGVHIGITPIGPDSAAVLAGQQHLVWQQYWRTQILWAWRNHDWDGLAKSIMRARQQFAQSNWSGSNMMALTGAEARLKLENGDMSGYEQLLRQISRHTTHDTGFWEDQAYDAWLLAHDADLDDAVTHEGMLIIKMYLERRLGWVDYFYDPDADYSQLDPYQHGLLNDAIWALDHDPWTRIPGRRTPEAGSEPLTVQ